MVFVWFVQVGVISDRLYYYLIAEWAKSLLLCEFLYSIPGKILLPELHVFSLGWVVLL